MGKHVSKLRYGNQGQLGQKKDDEFYTKISDIEDELFYWAALGKFKDKNIICPCDLDVGDSVFSVCYKGGKLYTNNVNQKMCSLFMPKQKELDYDDSFLSNGHKSNFVKILVEHANEWGIASITASGYNPETKRGISFANVNYKEYDLCITNPPFSLYKSFMKSIVGNIDFIVLAPFTNRVAPSCMVPIMENKAFLGYGISKHITFDTPDEEKKNRIINCDWITTFNEAQEERDSRHFTTGIKYVEHKDEFIVLNKMTSKEGTHPIKVSVPCWPDDYDDWMMASVMALDYLDQSKYEWVCLSCQGFLNKTNRDRNPLDRDVRNDMFVIDGKKHFNGNILFRRKK